MFAHLHHFIRSTLFLGHRTIVILACIFGLLVFAPLAQAQDGGPDPATNVEVGNATVWRDAVTTGSVTVTCYDASGKVVPNDIVSISITSQGKIVNPVGSLYRYSSSTTGTTNSNGTVTVTVISTDFTLVDNDATATVTASADGASGTGSVLFKGALELLCNNANVTNETNPCQVGELQLLQAKMLSGVSFISTWAASGATPIGGWDGESNPGSTLKTPFPPGSLDGTPDTPQALYLTTTGSDTATVTVQDYDADNNYAATASTSFTVSRPHDFAFSAVQQAAYPEQLGVELGNFADPNAPAGIVFTGSGGSGGTLSTAQTIKTDSYTYTDDQGSHPITVAHVPGIDNVFPYALSGSTDDNPSKVLHYAPNTTTHITEINQQSWSAVMHLMWKSKKNGSISIPVESILWSWYADATFDPNTGLPIKGAFRGSQAESSIAGTPQNDGVLEWTQRVVNK